MAKSPWAGIPLGEQMQWMHRLQGGGRQHVNLTGRSEMLHNASAHERREREQNLHEGVPKRQRKSNGGNGNRSRPNAPKQPQNESDLHNESEFENHEAPDNIPYHNPKARAWGNILGVAEWARSFGDAPVKKVKAWAIRGAQNQGNWSKVRPSLAAALVAAECVPGVARICTACNRNRTCVIRCKGCVSHEEGYALLCPDCDKAAHPFAHFHQREVWSQGYFKAIPAEQEFDEQGDLHSVGASCCFLYACYFRVYYVPVPSCASSWTLLLELKLRLHHYCSRRKALQCAADNVRHLPLRELIR